MKENSIYLTKNQVMAFICRIAEIKESDPNFNDEIVKDFEDYAINRAAEIVTTYPQIKLLLSPNANKYKVSKGLFDYLTKITSIDVYDKETIKKYVEISKQDLSRLYEKTNQCTEESECLHDKKTK